MAVAKAERPLFEALLLHGSHPPDLLAATEVFKTTLQKIYRGLSSVSRSRKGSEKVLPLRNFTILRISVGHPSLTIFAQRGSVSIYLLFRDTLYPLEGDKLLSYSRPYTDHIPVGTPLKRR